MSSLPSLKKGPSKAEKTGDASSRTFEETVISSALLSVPTMSVTSPLGSRTCFLDCSSDDILEAW